MMRDLPKLAAWSGSMVSGGHLCSASRSSTSASTGLAAMNTPQDGQYASINLLVSVLCDWQSFDKCPAFARELSSREEQGHENIGSLSQTFNKKSLTFASPFW
jgi:hypothetical protein